jgi:hypothetical protein
MDDADTFEPRSIYAMVPPSNYYGHPQTATWVTPQYVPVNNGQQFNAQMPQQPFANPMQAGYAPGGQGTFPPMLPNNGFAPQVNNMQPVCDRLLIS